MPIEIVHRGKRKPTQVDWDKHIVPAADLIDSLRSFEEMGWQVHTVIPDYDLTDGQQYQVLVRKDNSPGPTKNMFS